MGTTPKTHDGEPLVGVIELQDAAHARNRLGVLSWEAGGMVTKAAISKIIISIVLLLIVIAVQAR